MEELLWAAPALLLAAFIIGWAAETSEIYISQGLALAILAWLQTLPEFAVEALIAWHQKQDLMVANLTGSLRLLTGLGWPMIYFVQYFSHRKSSKSVVIKLPAVNALEVFMLMISSIYFTFIAIKGSLTIGDGIILLGFYAIYLYQLFHQPSRAHEEESDLPWIGKKIVKLKNKKLIGLCILGLFAVGGAILNFSVHPFLHGLEVLAVSLGISTFVFIQWISPFVSEFPEKVTAFQWARKVGRAPMAMMNMVGSNIVQFTVMTAMIPVIYSVSKGSATPIFFDMFQTHEIMLTVVQTVLGMLYLMDLEVRLRDAFILFTLWLIQFLVPHSREEMIFVYLFFIVLEVISLFRHGRSFYALKLLKSQVKKK